MPVAAAGLLALLLGPAHGKPGDEEKGESLYAARCQQCHGEEGDGLGPAAERLNPPPRDFTFGFYKFKSTAFDEDLPPTSRPSLNWRGRPRRRSTTAPR
jgi:hypothetical protein